MRLSRTALLRVYQVALVVGAAAVLAWQIRAEVLARSPELLIFTTLAAAVGFLTIRQGEELAGFESVVAFALIILHHDALPAAAAVFAGVAISELAAWKSRRSRMFSALAMAGEIALSYYLVGLLYCSAVAMDAAPMAKASGYLLLLIGYIVVRSILFSVRTVLRGADYRIDVVQLGTMLRRVLVVSTPVIAAETVLYGRYEAGGFLLGFVPILPIAYLMRRSVEADEHHESLQRQNRELAILTEATSQILSAEGEQETLRRLTTMLSNVAPMAACAVVTWDVEPDKDGTVYRFGECMRTDQEILEWVELAGFGETPARDPVVMASAARSFPLSPIPAFQVIADLQTSEVTYGVLIYETDDPFIVRASTMNVVTLLVNETAVSLQDQLLRRSMQEKTLLLEQQAATLSTILNVSTGLLVSQDIDQMLTTIARSIRESLGFEIVLVALREKRGDEYVRRAHAGLDDVWEDLRKRKVPGQEVAVFFDDEFRISKSFLVPYGSIRLAENELFVRHDNAPRSEEWQPHDLLIAPLVSSEQIIGYLAVRDPIDRKRPALETVQTLEIFANQAVAAVQSVAQVEEIRRLTRIDGLTNAFNHRYFQEVLAKELNRHGRTGHQFALAMLDIDNFKRINDSFGHPVGDEVLKGVVEAMLTNARDIDVVSRYGGEEFAVIFSETPAVRARDAANRLREVVEAREYRVPQVGRNLRLTISVGVATCPQDGTTSTDLIARADAALYEAKRRGKNRVVMAEELPRLGEQRA
jgi:diguanylate cyclase (GGDEF)-like protein